MSHHLSADVIKQSQQLTGLLSLSEKFSQCAYTTPLSATMEEELWAEVSHVLKAR